MAHSTRHTANYIESSQPQIKMSPKPPIVAEETDTHSHHSHRRHTEAPRSMAQRFSAAEEHVWEVACAAAHAAIIVC